MHARCVCGHGFGAAIDRDRVKARALRSLQTVQCIHAALPERTGRRGVVRLAPCASAVGSASANATRSAQLFERREQGGGSWLHASKHQLVWLGGAADQGQAAGLCLVVGSVEPLGGSLLRVWLDTCGDIDRNDQHFEWAGA
jgi:hypothetical protein